MLLTLPLRPPPHSVEEISKRSFISPVRPSNPSRKWSFSKTLFKPYLKTRRFVFVSVDGKHFENGAFRKRWRHDSHVTSLCLKHKSKMTGDCCVFKFLRRSVDGKHLGLFRREISVFILMVLTRMDTLKSGWTHYVYYTTHLFSSAFCLILRLLTCILSEDDYLIWCIQSSHNLSGIF